MRFSLRTLFWCLTGAGLVAFAATISSHYMFLVLALVVSLAGALAGRHQPLLCVGLSAFGGGGSLWVALFCYAFFPDWLRLHSLHETPPVDPAFAQFIRDTFWLQSLFVFMMGFGAGAALAALVWLYHVKREIQLQEGKMQYEGPVPK
jgi:hypothetical protein